MLESAKVNRPKDDPFRQQRLKAWQPIMTPWKVIILFTAIGVAFVPTGTFLLSSSNQVFEKTIEYDGASADPDCSISYPNAGTNCQIKFSIDEDTSGPLYVYFELTKFFQNHRFYIASVNYYQLAASSQYETKADLQSYCTYKYTNGSDLINPCGLIANSFFTDIITLNSTGSTPANLEMKFDDITWPSDKYKFKQPVGFEYAAVANKNVTCANVSLPTTCKKYYDSSEKQWYLFYYPNDDTVQYLYETYPMQISPIDGVTDPHFINWMRPAALPSFRKLYGIIDGDFKKGDVLRFNVLANYDVSSFDGTKSIVISTVGEFGGKNPYLGVAYIVVGSLSLLFGFLFAAKQIVAPRPYADISLLNWD
jgi:hypothetical protein